MIPSTDEQLADADTRVSTCQFLIQDITAELNEWKQLHESFIALDTSARRMFAMSRKQLNHVREYGDVLVENTNELAGVGGIKRGSALEKFLLPDQNNNDKNNNNDNDDKNKNNNGNNNANVNSSSCYYYYEAQQQVETETKSNLRMSVMLMGSRADSLQGAENMLTALCQCSKVCLLISRSIVSFLLQHRILAERASQLAHVSQKDSEHLLDFVIHTVRPIAIEEILDAKKELKNREHMMSVLFYSLSRQLSDTVLRCCNTLQSEESMMQQVQEEELGWTISGSGTSSEKVVE